MFDANADLALALLALGTSADVPAADGFIFRAGSGALSGKAEFDKGLAALRKLQ